MYRRLKNFNTTLKSNKRQMKKINVFAKTASISAIVLVGVLAFFLVLQFLLGEDVYVLMSCATCQRLFEFGFCLMVVIINWKLGRKKSKNTNETQQSSELSKRRHRTVEK
jgi:hypothetical protein